MTDTTYNGWTNKPTWAVNLWLANDEGLYRQTTELVERTLDNEPDANVHTVALAIRDSVEEILPTSGLAGDLIGWTLAQVNWDEIACGWVHDAQEILAERA